jgi:hypothetical protein
MQVCCYPASPPPPRESCACPGVASRVVVWEPLVWSSSVRQLEGWADGRLEIIQ